MQHLLIGQEPGVIRLTGELDLAALPQLWTAFASVPREDALVIDTADVRLLSAAALGALVHEASRRPAGVRLRNPRPLHRRILEVTRCDWLLDGRRT